MSDFLCVFSVRVQVVLPGSRRRCHCLNKHGLLTQRARPFKGICTGISRHTLALAGAPQPVISRSQRASSSTRCHVDMAGPAITPPSASSGNAAFAAIDKCPRRLQMRPTKALSWELASHTKAYLEMQQCMRRGSVSLSR